MRSAISVWRKDGRVFMTSQPLPARPETEGVYEEGPFLL